MAIDVEWQDERGERLARYEGPPIDGRLADSAPPDSICLRFIDPYGDTTFNQAQVAKLENELVHFNGEGDVVRQAKSLLSFIQQLDDRTHCYLKFIGD